MGGKWLKGGRRRIKGWLMEKDKMFYFRLYMQFIFKYNIYGMNVKKELFGKNKGMIKKGGEWKWYVRGQE